MEEDIRDNVVCGICHQILDEPKQLSCQHIFCLFCIDELFKKKRVKQYNGFSCPFCRKQTVLDNAGAKDLPDAPYELKRIIDIVKKRNGNGFLQEYKDAVKSEKSKCSKHPKEKIEFLCICSPDPFCKLCKEEHKEDKNHQILSSSHVLGQMTNMVKETEAKINSVHQERTIVEDCLKTLDISRTKSESDLECAFTKVQKEKEKIKKTLNENYDVEKSKLLHTQENLSKSLKSAKEIRERLSNILTFGIHGLTLSSWKKLKADNEELNSLRQEELNLRKCIYKFIPVHASSSKLGRIQKTKARRKCYVLMQQNENEEHFADDIEEDEMYDDIVSDYTSEEESDEDLSENEEHLPDDSEEGSAVVYDVEPVSGDFEHEEYEDDTCSTEGSEDLYETEPSVEDNGLQGTCSEDLYETEPSVEDNGLKELPREEKKRFVAVFDHTAEEENELDLEEGDIIYLMEEIYVGWWRGSLNGRTGCFQANYVEPLQEMEAAGTLKATDRRREPEEYKPKDIEEQTTQELYDVEEIIEGTEGRGEEISEYKTDMLPNNETETLEDEKENGATGNQLDLDFPPPLPARLYNTDLSKTIRDRPPMPTPRTNADKLAPVPIHKRPPMSLPIDASEEPTRVPPVTVHKRRPMPVPIYSSEESARVPPVPIDQRPPMSLPTYSTAESTREIPSTFEKDIKISGGTLLKRNLLMLCSHDESRVLIEDLTNENNSVSKPFNRVWDAAAESSAEFAFVSKLADKEGTPASIVKIDKNGDEIEVFTYHVKDPMGLAYAKEKLFVCEPYEKKVVVFCTKSKEKLGSIKYGGFKFPWFVHTSSLEDVFISDYKAKKVFRVKISKRDAKGFIEPTLCTKTPQFTPGKCTHLADKVYLCDQNEKCIKCVSDKYETLYVVKACNYRPFLIFNNCTETGELVIVSLNGDIEFFKV